MDVYATPSRPWRDAAIGALLGFIAYYALGFGHVLAAQKLDWLFYDTDQNPYYDPATYYLGWNYFRHAPWSWPLGLDRNYGMEFGGSIVYSDSIPVMAFLCKPFSRWLMPQFQYIGLWILICYVLQGMFALLIASRLTSRMLPKILITVFFVVSPVMLERSKSQYAHIGHWLILWAIYLYLTERQGKIRWIWMALAALAVTTSFYMVPMILGLWLADAVKAGTRIRFIFLEGAVVLASVLLVMWAAGYFVVPLKSAQTHDFGKYANNLLGPIDPSDQSGNYSLFLKSLPKSPYAIGGGYCYLGLGMIGLLCMSAHDLLRNGIPWKGLRRLTPLAVMMLGLGAFSLSDKIAFGSHVVEIPNVWGPMGSIFRASWRMCWPFYYGSWLATFYLVMRALKPWQAGVILSAALAVQLVDQLPYYITLHDRFTSDRVWTTPLTSPFWADAAKKYHAIVVIPGGIPFHYFPLALLASENGMRTNAESLARYPSTDVIDPICAGREQELWANRPNREYLYVLPLELDFNNLTRALSKEHGIGRINGYYVIAPYWFTDHAAGVGGLAPGPAN